MSERIPEQEIQRLLAERAVSVDSGWSFVAAAPAIIAQLLEDRRVLRDWVQKAPHDGRYCDSRYCDCWKRRALEATQP